MLSNNSSLLCHLHLGHLQFGLLQCTLHGTVLEEDLETLVDIEYGCMSNLGHRRWQHFCSVNCIRYQFASWFNSRYCLWSLWHDFKAYLSPLHEPGLPSKAGRVCWGLCQLKNFNWWGQERESSLPLPPALEHSPSRHKMGHYSPGFLEISKVIAMPSCLGPTKNHAIGYCFEIPSLPFNFEF